MSSQVACAPVFEARDAVVAECTRELLAQVMVAVMMLLLVFGEYDVGDAIVA
jgi:hypothetical protein